MRDICKKFRQLLQRTSYENKFVFFIDLSCRSFYLANSMFLTCSLSQPIVKTQSKIPWSLWFHAVFTQLLGPISFKFLNFLNLLYLHLYLLLYLHTHYAVLCRKESDQMSWKIKQIEKKIDCLKEAILATEN